MTLKGKPLIKIANYSLAGIAQPDVMTQVILNNYDMMKASQEKNAASPLIQKAQELKQISERKDDFLYVVARAISCEELYGCNNNGDAFPAAELEASFRTFVGCGHFVDHDTGRAESVRGIVLDAHWHPVIEIPEGQLVSGDMDQGGYITLLLGIDRRQFPQYASQVESGTANRFSMGVRVTRSQCSVCGNWAQTERDFCEHIPNLKSLYVNGGLCYESNYGLGFIEFSAVSVPADPTAVTLCKVASALGKEKKCSNCGCGKKKSWWSDY